MKDCEINVRLTDEEIGRLKEKAEQYNITPSEFLRQKIEEGILEDEEFDNALIQLADNLKIEADKLNRAATDANMNGVKQTHADVAKQVMKNQIILLQEFENQYLKNRDYEKD